MPAYSVNPILHNQGGLNTPYEKYHLTEAEWRQIIRTADSTQAGLAPADVMKYMNYVDPPADSSTYGEEGMRALDSEYFYLYTNKWKRIKLFTV